MKRHLAPLALACSALVAGLVILGLSIEGQLGWWATVQLATGTFVLGASWLLAVPPATVRVPVER